MKLQSSSQASPCNTQSIYDKLIVDSWNRSYAAKVDQADGYCNNVLTAQDIKQVLDNNYELMQIAKPLMKNMYEVIKNSGFILVLTDQSGRIIESFGDREIIYDAKKLNFIRGASWLENDVGTNAIGTALVIGKPIQITGAKHYCKKHHTWTCSAAPIYNKNGQIMGVINISGHSSSQHPHTLGMVTSLAKTITIQFTIKQMNQDAVASNKKLAKVFDKISDGLIEIDKNNCVVNINPVVRNILGRSEHEIIGRSVGEILGSNLSFIDNQKHDKFLKESILKSEDWGDKYLILSEQIFDRNGKNNGGVILLKKLNETRKVGTNLGNEIQLYSFEDIIGKSNAIKEVKHKASLAADSTATVILQGESGTGKELFAQSIHRKSARQEGPFIAINCGAIPRDLIVSELFGYDEGAFTGARKGGKPGKFEQASGGTLFLDEIGELPLEQQVALLRVLQERKVSRLGSHKLIPLDVRIICATNKNLVEEVAKGKFRQDLYYRLNVLCINIPPLRSRREDIVPLFQHFLKKHEDQLGKKFMFEPEVLRCLERYDWPGNVRELQNIVERMVCLAQDGIISLSGLPAEMIPGQGTELQPESLFTNRFDHISHNREERKLMAAENERREIIFLLNKNGGNVSLTARDMGVSRNTIYRKMRAYGIKN
jgi:transcriptional regulator of acetoin/glycerol metabolism